MTVHVAITFLEMLEGVVTEKVVGDSGGLTKNGVTQADYDAFRTRHGLPLQSVALMTDPEMDQDYEETYWTPGGCGMLPPGLDFLHFQWCVNHGTVSATRCLKTAIYGRPQVGQLDGPLTPADVQVAYSWGTTITVEERYFAIQSSIYDRISQAHLAGLPQTQLKFFDGWENRIQRTRDIIAGRPLSV